MLTFQTSESDHMWSHYCLHGEGGGEARFYSVAMWRSLNDPVNEVHSVDLAFGCQSGETMGVDWQL